MLSIRNTMLALIAVPLALGLAACGKGGDAAKPSGEPMAKVAAPAGKEWSEVVSKTDEGGFRMGNPDAPIKLVEYGSLSCPHCAKFSLEGFQTLTKDFVGSGRVSYEYRSFAIHPIDIPMTMLVRCGAPESAFALIEQIYVGQPDLMAKATQNEQKAQAAYQLPDKQRFVSVADAYGLTAFFSQRGIAVDQANACLGKIETATEIAKQSQDQGEEFKIEGTPTFLINGAKIEGNTWDVIKAQLENAGAR